MKNIRIALKQFCPVPGRTEQNFRIILETVEEAARGGAGLLCLPECSLTGYSTGVARDISVEYGNGMIGRICAAAAERDLIVSFGFIEKREERLFISNIITGADGTVCYRKTHLGSRERLVFDEGNEFPVYCSEGLVIGACLCWESHIPDIAAVYRGKGAHILLFPYASGMHGVKCRENWNVHLPARASDNGVFVAAVNGFYREDGECGGGMALFDPKGREVSSYFGKEDRLIFADAPGPLPRDTEEDMHNISYFDRRRPELFL